MGEKLKLKTTVIKSSVHMHNENPIFGYGAIHVSIDDDVGGGYIVLEQFPDTGTQRLALDLEELELVLKTARKMLGKYDESNS